MSVECTYCEEKVNAKRGIYIKCIKCQDIKLCLECFSAGATIAEHESDHPYELIDCGSFPIIDESWKAYEELALLEAIELYGIGSWTDIANAVETRSAEECCERYLRIYVDNFFGRSAWNSLDKNLYKVYDHTCTHNQPLSPSLSLPEKHKIVDISKEQQVRLGYMPKRDDFEREFDNEAELLVSKLAVTANDDTDLDQDLKIAHINMYTDQLRERFRRKRIVLEYNLVKLFFHMHPEENGDVHNSNTSDAITTPALLMAKQPSESGLHSIETKNIIDDKYTTPNSNNATTPSQSVAFKSNTGKDSSSRLISHNGSNNHHQDTKKSSSTANEKTNPPVHNTILNYFRRVEPQTESAFKKSSSSDSADNSILSSYFSDLNRTIAEQDFNTMEKKLRIFCQFSSADDHNLLIRNLQREKELKVRIKELIKNLHRNQTSEPSSRLLNPSEKKICRSFNLKPSQYISVKANIIKEHNRKKKKGATQRLFKDDIDGTVKRRILDYLTRNNWIKV